MKKVTTSRVIVYAIVSLDIVATLAVIILCYIAVFRGYLGSLPFLSALIAALQAATGIILNGYFGKSKAENTKGGITYDAALGNGRTI